MIEKMATDFIMQMTENKLICKEMEERYIYAFICMVEKIITIGSIVVIGLITHNLLPTILFLIFFWELRKRTGGYHLDKFYKCYLATVASCLIVMIIGINLVEHIMSSRCRQVLSQRSTAIGGRIRSFVGLRSSVCRCRASG